MDDPRPLRLRPQTEEPARAHVSPSTVSSPAAEAETATGYPLGTASEGVFAEARAALVREGNRRRKLQRIQRAIHKGCAAGSIALCLAYFLYYRSRVSATGFLFAPILMQIVPLLAPIPQAASRRQKEALANLVPGAEKSDLSWLIEGTQYADTPELRLALLEKIRGFFADLTPEDAVLLPEGARKILRSWPGGVFRSEPDVAQEALRALAVIEDPKLPQVLKGIARWRPRHLGDEETIHLATDALGLPPREFPAPPATREEAEKAIAEEQILRRHWDIGSGLAAFVGAHGLLAGSLAWLIANQLVWATIGFSCLFGAIVFVAKKVIAVGNSKYREAVAEAVLARNVDG